MKNRTTATRARDFATRVCDEIGASEHVGAVAQAIVDAIEETISTAREAGKEAEELRAGIEAIVDAHSADSIEDRIRAVLDDEDPVTQVAELLEEVDARDSEAWWSHKRRTEWVTIIAAHFAHYAVDHIPPDVRVGAYSSLLETARAFVAEHPDPAKEMIDHE